MHCGMALVGNPLMKLWQGLLRVVGKAVGQLGSKRLGTTRAAAANEAAHAPPMITEPAHQSHAVV